MVAKLRGWPCGENRENWYTNLGVWIDELRTTLKSGIRPCLHGITNSVGIELVRIPAGTFWMGSPEDEIGRDPLEGPRREVKIDKPFYLGVYTVTQEEYERVTGNNPSYFKQSERHPVECVSWDEAWKFCVALNQLPEELVAGRYYSLPTEAEWEYACRGPGAPSDPFHYGKAITMEEANVLGSCPYRGRRSAELICEEGLRHTVPVQSYVPNGWGLYQMHGNVAEWCFGKVPRCVSSY
jgi:formylglycine-generating enzyme required for sulfatase activity